VFVIAASTLSFAWPFLAGASAGLTLARSPVPRVAEGRSIAVAQMVRGILSYTRWPGAMASIRLCVAGAPLYGAKLAETEGAGGRAIQLRSLLPGEGPGAAGCDGLYLGRMAAAERSQLIAEAHGQAIVTIDENDPACRAGAMFCLAVEPTRLSFQLNLDAVSRGAVRIDPKVLLLARAPEGQP